MFFAVVLWLLLAEQSPPQTPFKSGVNLVEVDVVVTDKGGKPIRGLTQQDFEVFEDGKPVEIATLVAVDLPPAPADATIPPADLSGTSIRSNDQPEDGRVLLIVLDDYHVRFDAGYAKRTRTIARRLVERLGPSDQVAVIATSGRAINQAEFTDDKARLAEAIDRFFPQSEQTVSGGLVADSLQRSLSTPGGGGGLGFVGEMKARWAMDTLGNAAKALAEIPHRRKAILLVSEGLPVSVDEIISNQYAAGAWDGLRDFIFTAQRSNVAVYPVDPCGLSTECSTAAQDNLRTLADSTGGFAVLNTNAPEDSVDRIVEENGTYYLLGYSSPAAPNDGRRHRIKVRSRVPDVEVRARDGYISPRRASKPAAPPVPLEALVAAPIQSRGLTMRVAAVPAPLGHFSGGRGRGRDRGAGSGCDRGWQRHLQSRCRRCDRSSPRSAAIQQRVQGKRRVAHRLGAHQIAGRGPVGAIPDTCGCRRRGRKTRKRIHRDGGSEVRHRPGTWRAVHCRAKDNVGREQGTVDVSRRTGSACDAECARTHGGRRSVADPCGTESCHCSTVDHGNPRL